MKYKLPGWGRFDRESGYQLLAKGWDITDISSALDVHPSTVRRWRKTICPDQTICRFAVIAKGRPKELSDGEKHKVLKMLSQGPRACGIPEARWTTRSVTVLIRKFLDRPWGKGSTRTLMKSQGWTSIGPDERWDPPIGL